MGIPARYSLEVPERCLQLLECLWPEPEKAFVPGQEAVGPLTTTFHLGMATPIITLPIERVERHRGKGKLLTSMSARWTALARTKSIGCW